ncbi:C2H2 and C2HC zinc finger [Venturia nashicola]|uniref:C2H2 and C2HC zinc finger n=1 Tax=Venturia nashicola TaxID=86259 RepID=A0A4Z1PIU3_9PEZI|nr:C2H2 and C2HC zinc finger [Venturia nashicola]TLD39617.1 C2H2 and C2HC zinc finger [Venturia nashicola]
MPKAEVGSTKWLGNKMKAKGLQRLRWYCTPCEKQCRDENGFKQHTMSEGHVRNMTLVGENSKSYIRDYSNQFKRDFLYLLRTAHGEKKIHANHFYQEYIANKEHIHMNATQWPSLTEFIKAVGREGIVRVYEEEKGLFIAWVDDSPEALQRRDAVRKKERQDKGDEERELRMLQDQIERAKEKARLKELEEAQNKPESSETEPAPPKPIEKISLKLSSGVPNPPATSTPATQSTTPPNDTPTTEPPSTIVPVPKPAPMKLSLSNPLAKPKNPLAAGKKSNPLANKKSTFVPEPAKKMSEAERIMREEMDKKNKRGPSGGDRDGKRQKFG